jgi:hypothetical protein
MFETRSDAWEQAGLDATSDPRTIRKARRQAALLLALLVGILVVYYKCA